ncbi:MAG TPA: hypothetical protein VLJ62_23325, partial [Burkholderiaceae bacterium]|nr:hypothetical protein [Burkholderiaceae bacterium]
MVPKEEVANDDEAGFTLDPSLLAERRAAGERRMQTVQMPIVRTVGFVIVCLLVVLDDWRIGAPLDSPQLRWLIVANLLYATLSWPLLRWAYDRGRVDWGLVFLHLDVVVWLLNLYHIEPSTLFFGYFLLV